MVFQSAHYKRQEDDDQESLERFESDPTVSFFCNFYGNIIIYVLIRFLYMYVVMLRK